MPIRKKVLLAKQESVKPLIERIKKVMTEKEIIQSELAQALDTNHVSINQWLNGKAVPNAQSIALIEEWLQDQER